MPIWNLPDDLCEIPTGKMPTGKKIYHSMNGTIPDSLLDYTQMQTATMNRIEFANYHYQVLNSAYGFSSVPTFPKQNSVAREEMNSIILNLIGAFDCMAHEINIIQNLQIPEREVIFGHKHNGNNTTNCIICRLSSSNSNLSTLLQSIIDNAWFKELKEYRNHIHKRLPVIQVAIVVGGNSRKITLPDNPSNYNPQSKDFSKKIELQTYCNDMKEKVMDTIEKLYQQFETEIRNYVTTKRNTI